MVQVHAGALVAAAVPAAAKSAAITAERGVIMVGALLVVVAEEFEEFFREVDFVKQLVQ